MWKFISIFRVRSFSSAVCKTTQSRRKQGGNFRRDHIRGCFVHLYAARRFRSCHLRWQYIIGRANTRYSNIETLKHSEYWNAFEGSKSFAATANRVFKGSQTSSAHKSATVQSKSELSCWHESHRDKPADLPSRTADEFQCFKYALLFYCQHHFVWLGFYVRPPGRRAENAQKIFMSHL